MVVEKLGIYKIGCDILPKEDWLRYFTKRRLAAILNVTSRNQVGDRQIESCHIKAHDKINYVH